MKGSNTIEVNMATVAEAMQEYFDKRGKDGKAAFTITSCKPNTQSIGYSLIVETGDPEPEGSGKQV